MALVDSLVELYRRVATEMSPDVLAALEKARDSEVKGTPSFNAIDTVLENIRLAEENSKPMCQDTGTPIFYIKRPERVTEREIRDAILEATRRATREVPLRPNAVDVLTGRNSGDNTGLNTPVTYFSEWGRDYTRFDLMLKGGGSENIGLAYRLPDNELGAGRDLEGVRILVLNAVYRAQGKGCPPMVVGVGLGGPKDAIAVLSKEQLLRPLDDVNPVPELAELERRLLKETNALGIGPAGLGGRTTVLGVKIGVMHRHPASYFVDVCFSCWACRRGSMDYKLE